MQAQAQTQERPVRQVSRVVWRSAPGAALPRRRWLQALGLFGLAPALGLGEARADRSVRLIGGMLPLGLAGPTASTHPWGDKALEEARRLGFHGDIEWMPWARAVQEARRGGPALVFPLLRSPEREAAWQWLRRLGREQWVLWVRRDVAAVAASAAGLQALRVGVVRGSLLGDRLRNQGFETLSELSTEEANLRMLAAGRIDAWATLSSVSQRLMTPLADLRRLLHAPLVLGELDVYLAATHDVTVLPPAPGAGAP